jgi:hypothetical protein
MFMNHTVLSLRSRLPVDDAAADDPDRTVGIAVNPSDGVDSFTTAAASIRRWTPKSRAIHSEGEPV